MERFDLLIIGGGINGTAIARDAALRGLSVLLVERDDLASHTSSASSKLAHGGLRYLEQGDFRLVREALAEREILLRTAPHLARPLRFILPDPPGGRPWWMIRAGLLLYDLLAGRGSSLPRARSLAPDDPAVAPLKSGFRCAAYWDAWIDDSRLTVLNAVAAAEQGAEIATRTEFLSAQREDECWRALLGGGRQIAATMIVNAAGPWVEAVRRERLGLASGETRLRLVRGSHIVVPRLTQGDDAFILQQPDGRVVFVLPFEGHSLIGTTDRPVARPEDADMEEAEADYLLAAANGAFPRPTAREDIIWSYAGIRALFDDGAGDAKNVTRDYHLVLNADGPKALSVFGGKITTARALAEEALERLGVNGPSPTARTALPGGAIPQDMAEWADALAGWMPTPLRQRLIRAYGDRLARLLDGRSGMGALGRQFGGGLTEAEVAYLRAHEFARTADDILWRRSKLGLHLSAAEQADLRAYLGG